MISYHDIVVTLRARLTNTHAIKALNTKYIFMFNIIIKTFTYIIFKMCDLTISSCSTILFYTSYFNIRYQQLLYYS